MTLDALKASIAAIRGRPAAVHVVQTLAGDYASLFAGQIETLITRHGDRFWDRAEHLVGLSSALGGDPVHAIVEYTMAYLREQVRFLESDDYSNHDFDQVLRDVYANPEVMEGFYLHGLLLTHAFWPIHFELHDFFERAFLPRVAPNSVGAEWGFGHALYLAEALQKEPSARAIGRDISEFSVAFGRRLLAHEGIAPARFDLALGDVRSDLGGVEGGIGWAVFAEIIEHIPEPEKALRRIRDTLAPGGALYATTVIDSNAIDHLVRFRDANEVRAMLTRSGFAIVDERVVSVRELSGPESRDPSIDIACVCVPA